MLHIVHQVEECADTLAFATEPVYASLANILAYQVNFLFGSFLYSRAEKCEQYVG